MSWADEYLREVAEQIRVKRIRGELTEELREHMELQKADFMDEGLPEAEAERRTIEEMGSALLVGGELDRVHRPKPQWQGMILALALMLIGILLRTVFTPMGQAQPVDLMQCAGVCVAMGAILLLGLTDYMLWIRLAVPLTAAWGALIAVKIIDGPNWISHYIPSGLHAAASIHVLFRVTPEHIALAAPILTGLMIAAKRGGGRGALLACFAVPAATLLLGLSYTWRSYTPHTVMLMALLCTALLALAVRKGFFRIRRRGAYIALSGLAVVIGLTCLLVRSGELPAADYYAQEYVYPLLRQAKMWGSSSMDAELISRSNELYRNDLMLPFIIYRYGWAAFAFLTAAAGCMLIWAGRRFARMENRTGSLMGMACVMTFGVQMILYYIHSFTIMSWPLGFPLISYGTIVLWIDAAMIGLMLSVLRGENLPETECIGRRTRRGGLAA